MKSFYNEFFQFSSERRALFEALLDKKGIQAVHPSPIVPRVDVDNFPLSFAQQRLWFIDQLLPNTPLYNTLAIRRLTGTLHIETLERSLNEIVRRHEALRTIFTTVDGNPVQVILPALSLALSVVDIQEFSKREREIEVQRWAAKETMRPFDLTHGPLIRARVLRLSRQEYVLLLVTHHIVSDGWSNGIFFHELAEIYTAFAANKPSPLPELAIQYVDYAIWQRKWLSGDVLEQHLTYWKQQLTDIPSVLNLPIDRPRPAIPSFRGTQQNFVLPTSLTASLKELSSRKGVTLFMTLLAAFQVLLARYTGQEDIVVGSPIANRTQPEIEKLIGFFVNILVLRTHLSGNPTFYEVLEQVRGVCLDAYTHQDLPFEKLVEELHPQRDLRNQPLFQVVFQLQNISSKEALQLPEITMNTVNVRSEVARFDLAFHLQQTIHELKGTIEYSTELFDDTTIGRLQNHFQNLLESIVATPDQCIWTLPLISKQENQQLLKDWNLTGAEYSMQCCIHELVEDRVEQNPNALAVDFEGKQLTYSELNMWANQLAYHLRNLGVRPGVLIAVYMERSLEMIPALLGILKAGGAYVPIETNFPIARIEWILSSFKIPIMITQTSQIQIIRQMQELPELTSLVCMDSHLPPSALPDVIPRQIWTLHHLTKLPTKNVAKVVTSEDLAYIIFTSGSMGSPKGVMIRHRSVINLIEWVNSRFGVNASDRVLFVTSLCFDLSVYDVFGLLAAGGSIRVISSTDLHNPERLLHILAEESITFWNSAPPVLQQLTPFFSAAKTVGTTTSLRLAFLSGDWIPVKLPDQMREVFPDVEIVNLGGATETTIWSNYYCIEEVADHWGSIPYGKPIQNVQYYILDNFLSPCPIGVPGNLYVGGECLASGYASDPELTAQKFIPDPFSDQLGTRLYNTGDMARFWADGTIEFLGRLDTQVKIRGFRVELGEIESVLVRHLAVREALVLAHTDTPSDKRLVAYVVSALGQHLDFSDLRHFLQSQLPNYMVPSAFMQLEMLPLTTNGKIDQRSLPAPDQNRLGLQTTYVAPRSSVEETLAIIWTKVLRLDRVGIHDNFFELGGDSIRSIQIIAQATQAGLRITPLQTFQYQTIARLAEVAKIIQSTQAEQDMLNGAVPLTPIQRWFFEQNFINLNHFNQAFLFETRQNLELALLEQSMTKLFLHHDALRLRFRQTPSGWQQFYAAAEEQFLLTYSNLSALAEQEQAPAIQEAANKLQVTLNLEEGPLLRAAYFDLGPSKPGRLLVIIHHLVVDIVSWNVLLEDLQRSYEYLSRGEAIQLPLKTTSFRQWAKYLTQYARSQELRNELNYWLSEARQHIVPLPIDFRKGKNTVASSSIISASLSREETLALTQELPKRYHTQINEVLLTALILTFAQWTGISTLLVDVEGHGREHIFEDIDLSRTVGWFTSIIPVLLTLQSTVEPKDALESVKKCLRNIPNRGLGYGLLRYLSEDEEFSKKLQALPQSEVIFNYLGQREQERTETSLFTAARESVGSSTSREAHRHHLLEVSLWIARGELQIRWTYSKHLHKYTTITNLAQNYVQKLKQLISLSQPSNLRDYASSEFSQVQIDQQSFEESFTKDFVPLTISQSWFLKEGYALNPHHWHTISFKEVQQVLDPTLITQALQNLLIHHDALRLRFIQEELVWRQHIVDSHPNEPVPFTWINLSELSDVEQELTIKKVTTELQKRVNIFYGPLIQVAYFELKTQQVGRLLWVTHHLVTDSFSNQILFQDFETIYRQLQKGEKVCFPPKTTSFKLFAEQLHEYACSKEVLQELDNYWLKLPWNEVKHLPVDYPEGKISNTISSTNTLEISLSLKETDDFLKSARITHTQIPDLLLAVIAQAFKQWTQSPLLHVVMVDHGRITPFVNIDLSRTVGLIFHGKHILLFSEDLNRPQDLLYSIKEQIKRIPNRGIGVGALHYFNKDVDILEKERVIPTQEIDFNYHGHFNQNSSDSSIYGISLKAPGLLQSPQELRPRLLVLDISIVDGRLHWLWQYSENIYQRSTIEALAKKHIEVLRMLVGYFLQ